MKKLKTVIIALFVLIAAIAGVTIVNNLGNMLLQSIFGTAINLNGIPTSLGSTIAFLTMVFIAGMTAASMVASLARSNLWILVGILTLIAFITDFFAIFQGRLSELALWAQIVVIVSIPPQMWLGAKIGIWLRQTDSIKKVK